MKFSEFSHWLAQQRERNSPVGDLARDAFDDKETYKLATLDAWLAYLDSPAVRACDGAMDACRQAWREFEAGLNW